MHEEYECPCEACNGVTLDPDSHCTKCMHEGCTWEPKCQ